MSSIDKRIVQMQFDNQNFESGVKTTMSSLQKLNEKLKMKNSTDGLDQVSKGISKLSASGMSGLSSGVETVTAKFSALGVIGMTALANITNSAVNAGKKIVKSLTIDPITTGFSEYETKMGSIQTILTNTAHQGTTLDDVTKALNELNTYADKTIYNFAEMTKNIGTFTAAGVDLDTSTAAIKGIANLAAASGSTSQQASTAMYQLSQALAAGKVSLMDWNSVVNAGMGGKLFQDALIRTSEVLGTGAESMIKKYGSFRESLTKGEWLTSEVLTETLKQLSGAYTEADLIAQGFSKSQAKQIVELANNASAAATEVKTVTQLFDTMKESVQSGWATSWEHIIGDKNEATKLLTSISDGFNNIIGPSTEARNNMLKFWNEAGGRDDVISGLTNIIQSLGKGLGSIGDAWKEVFPSMTGEKLVDLSKKFKNLTENFKMSDETASKIKNTFKGVFTVFDTAKDAVVGLVKGLSPIGGVFAGLGSIVLSVTSGIGGFVSKIGEAVSKSGAFEKMASGLQNAFKGVGDFLANIGDGISQFFEYIGSLDFSKAFGFLGKGLSGIWNGIQPIFDGIGNAIGSINFNTIMNVIKGIFSIEILKTLKGIFDEVGGMGESVSGMFKSFAGIGKNIKGVLDGARESLEAWQQNLSAGTLMKLAGSIAILAGSLLLLASIDVGKLGPALLAMAGLFGELVLALAVIGKLSGLQGLWKVGGALLMMSTAMLVLSGAMKNLSSLNIGEIMSGLVSMLALLKVMGASVKMFSGSSKGFISTATGLIIFGAAMHVMASALKSLGAIDTETLGAGLFALAGLLTELALFLAAAKFGKLGVEDSVGILVLSGSLLVLSQAVKQFGSLNTDEIIRGLVGIAGVLTEIALFSKFSGSGLGMAATAVGLGVMSAAMLVMSAAMKSLGQIQWEEIARGLVAMAGALSVIGVAGALINGAHLTLAAVGVGAMSAALLVLSAALHSMGGMSWDEIARGMIVLAGALTILSVAMYAMTGCIAGAAAMVIMSAALALFVPQMLLLSQLSLQQVGAGLLALAGAFTVLGLAGLALSPLVPVLIALGGAVALLGVGCLAAGAGISAFGTGLALVAATLGASGMVILEFVKQLINTLPQLGIKAGEAMVNFAGAIANGTPQIVGAFTALIGSMITAIGTLIPEITSTAVELVVQFARALAQGVPQMISAGMELITGILEGIANNIGNVVSAGADVIVNFLNGVASNLGRVIQAGINLALSFIEGVANGISSNTARLQSAIRSVMQAMIQAGIAVITGGISAFVSGGKQLITGLVNGIKSMASSAGSAVTNCINSAKRAASGLGSALVSAGRSLIQGLVSGITSMASSVAAKAKSVVQGAINAAKSALKINSPSKVFIEIGKYTSEGFAVGLDRYARYASDSATSLANSVIDNVKNPLSSIAKIIDGEIDTSPVISPVMDLTNVKNGTRTLTNMLSNDAMKVNATTGLLASSIGTIQNRNDNSDIISALKDLKKTVASGGNTTNYINGITYDDGSNVKDAVETLIRAATIERRL